jgi:WD40 repeat protein
MDDKTELKNARSQSLQGNFTERISKTAFSYDERLIGCSSWTGEVRVFDMKTRETVSTLFSKTPVLDIAFKNDCNGIACGTLSGEVLFSHAMTMSSSLEERSTSDEMMKVVGTHEVLTFLNI